MRRLWPSPAFLFFAATAVMAPRAIVACGGTDNPGDSGDGGAGDGTAADGGGDDGSIPGNDGGFTDGGGGGDTGSDASKFSDGGGLGGGSGKPCNTATDCPATEQCIANKCGCPPYSLSCNGVCIVTSNDPNNCGGCGIACNAPKACSGNSCNGNCLTGLQKCPSGACVDTQSDNNNCGTCGHKCNPDGGNAMGCVGGSCQAAAVYTSNSCVGGGPPIQLDTGVDGGAGTTCAGNLAQVTFTWGVCSCKNISSQSSIYIDGFNSLTGGYNPAMPTNGGGAGANGQVSSTGSTNIYGDLWASNLVNPQAQAMDTTGQDIHNNLKCGGNLNGDSLKVDGDAYVAGDISGSVTIAGKLYQSPNKAHPSAGGGVVNNATVTVPEACNCTPIPVVALVTAHQSPNNDNNNVTPHLDPNLLASGTGLTRVDLPCGYFYFEGGIHRDTTIVAHGHTAVFIHGDVTADNTTFQVDPTGELDVFVSGSITNMGSFTFGNPNYPALTRLYVGGTTFSAQSVLNMGGNLWAANANVTWTSTADAYGSILVGNLSVEGGLKLHHDNAVASAGETCPGPKGSGVDGGLGGDGGSGSDGGGSGTGPCGSCKDCGNQACNAGTCGPCASSADCCAPLYCDTATGTCKYPPK